MSAAIHERIEPAPGFHDVGVGVVYYPAFNVADIAITSGAIMLVIDALMHTRRTKAPPG